MSRIEKLRERSKVSQEIYDKKVQRAYDAVKEYMDSDFAKLTIANHVGNKEDVSPEFLNKFSQEIVDVVADEVLDPVKAFEDVCKQRNFKPSEIRKIVKSLSSIFNLAVDGDYDAKRRAVAEYLQNTPRLYEDMVNFM